MEKISQRILEQCSDCYYWVENTPERVGGCLLFHGVGIAIPCEDHLTEDQHKKLCQALETAQHEASVKYRDITVCGESSK